MENMKIYKNKQITYNYGKHDKSTKSIIIKESFLSPERTTSLSR